MSMNTTNCTDATEQLLEVKNITKSFGNTVVLDGFSYKFERGVYVLSEPSGAGKTTLLRILCGLEVADSGTVLKSPDANGKYHACYTVALKGAKTKRSRAY